MEISHHVIDWSTATVEWSVEGFELVVALVPAASFRLAVAIADSIDDRVDDAFQNEGASVVAIEPDNDEPAELLVTSPVLLTLNPHGLRDLMNSVADDVANKVTIEEARDAELIATWIRLLRQ